jgi:hypothetical protein
VTSLMPTDIISVPPERPRIMPVFGTDRMEVFCAPAMHIVWEDEAEIVTHEDGCSWYACVEHHGIILPVEDHACIQSVWCECEQCR